MKRFIKPLTLVMALVMAILLFPVTAQAVPTPQFSDISVEPRVANGVVICTATISNWTSGITIDVDLPTTVLVGNSTETFTTSGSNWNHFFTL